MAQEREFAEPTQNPHHGGPPTTPERIIWDTLIMQGVVAEELHILVQVPHPWTNMPLQITSDRGPFHTILLADCTTGHIIGLNVI
jgi:hypothetical protein